MNIDINPNALNEELIGREIFDTLANLLGWKVDYTTDLFDFLDLHVTLTDKLGNTHNIGGEIKNRLPSAITFKTHIITLHKIKALIEYNNKYGFFINIFGDDIFIYNAPLIAKLVKSGKLLTRYWNLPNYNVAGTGYHCEKVVEVPKSYSVHFLKVDGIWKRIKE